VVSHRQLLLVQHHNRLTGETYWCLPGGGRESGETFEEAGGREVYEETGVHVRDVYRLLEVEAGDYAVLVAEAAEHVHAHPTVDLAAEEYLIGAAWHPISRADPLEPLNPAYWASLKSVIAAQLERDSAVRNR
jgi:8-oxo-dGTP pyrophosphatase MutT (NUDIX family)